MGQWSASAQTGENAAPFTLTISVNSPDFSQDDAGDKMIHIGSAVSVRIRKTNLSDHEIQKTGPDNQAFGYIFDLRDSNGVPVLPHKRRSPWIRGGGPSATAGTKETVLQPGESKVDFAPLSDWYDLSKPGTYTLQISQRISGEASSAVIQSNKITITLAP
jgi:hypothetical protein